MKAKKSYPVIEVPAHGKPQWDGGAFVMCFVYSKYHGNFILKGYHDEVRTYLRENYTHYFCNYTAFSKLNGKRVLWKFWKDNISIFEPSKMRRRLTNNNKYEIVKYDGIYDYTRIKTIKFKRLPKKWIPEFDEL
ncbi:MAG: hypothetical protein ACOC2W_02810 [bacterium]